MSTVPESLGPRSRLDGEEQSEQFGIRLARISVAISQAMVRASCATTRLLLTYRPKSNPPDARCLTASLMPFLRVQKRARCVGSLNLFA